MTSKNEVVLHVEGDKTDNLFVAIPASEFGQFIMEHFKKPVEVTPFLINAVTSAFDTMENNGSQGLRGEIQMWLDRLIGRHRINYILVAEQAI